MMIEKLSIYLVCEKLNDRLPRIVTIIYIGSIQTNRLVSVICNLSLR